jgi:diguanylate cyclase (GGDEF)-like protein/hemerythrin-like metal-binding protein
MQEVPSKHLWLIRTHHRMRTASFVLMFVAMALHEYGKGFGLTSWVILALALLVYPHIQHWRSRRAADPVRVVMSSMLVDAVVLGGYMAAVGFSQWLSFAALLGIMSNNTVNKGWSGAWHTVIALIGGALLWILFDGFHFAPETNGPATITCIVGLGWYVLAMNVMAFSRNRKLWKTRGELMQREQDLVTANNVLQQSLTEIDLLQVQLREQATRDALTGLYNRGYLDSTLERELARCKREGEALSVVMIDVDHFKRFNDHYGHQAGDECLKNVARTLQASARRASDLVARYGGEEFSLVLPHTDAAAAQQLAEAVRLAIEGLDMPHELSPQGRVTISVGVATMAGGSARSVASLLRAADEALYRAKGAGRNRVMLAEEELLPARTGSSSLANYVQLVWEEAHECKHALIDMQHRQLFDDANKLLAEILGGSPREALLAAVDALTRDVVEHFADEESILASAEIPGAEAHVTKHQELVAQLLDRRNRFASGELGIGDVFQFITRELIASHVLGDDKDLARNLKPQA